MARKRFMQTKFNTPWLGQGRTLDVAIVMTAHNGHRGNNYNQNVRNGYRTRCSINRHGDRQI